jgi:isoleucyl-tRNA synthetase
MPEKKSQFAEIEEKMLAKWANDQTFEKSVKQREGAEYFSFYDGPPFANGLPHFGHSLVTSIKDSLGRYKTMRGYYVERRNGWDCHGLPVEFAIEKEFGVSGKKQILELGLDKFNAACRSSVFKYKGDWEDFFERIGRWTDTKHAYATIDKEYTESVWWVLKQVHDKGLLYKGYKSMPYCPRCETPLSNFEVNEGYKDNVPDPSLYVKFKLVNEDASLLAWTTTPWSLPGNAAIAVNPKQQYVYVHHVNDEGVEETLILAKERLSVLDERDYTVTKEVSGKELAGKEYEPLFKAEGWAGISHYTDLYHVVEAPFVSIEDGTGVLHVAPAFGEDDLSLTESYKLPVLSSVDPSGHVLDLHNLPEEAKGKFFKGADRPIIEHLTHQGRVFSAETFKHTYPFCYRCETPLLYYAISTWFIKVSAIKKELLTAAEPIEWVPDHIKEGRFGKWLEGARDWAISRNRYWGAPMPIWVNEADETDYIVVESVEELQKLAGKEANLDDLHRPFIDDVTFEKDGKKYRRVEEVLDCWFESGSMPVAQQHYPFANAEKFEQTFPADYIGEGLDQTRLWFYVLHVISTILFDKPAYKNVLVNGMIMAADGQKLSKRLKNYPPVDDVFATEGADSLRLYLLSNYQAVAGDYMRFNRDAMKDLNRNVLGTLLNTFRFFKMYTDIDKWQPPKGLTEPKVSHVLDEWLLARLNQTIAEVTEAADGYKLAYAINPIFAFVDDLSNWYVRRSRRRFWKSENDTDKEQAYETLWYVLMRTSQLLAPWAPFISDYLWNELTDDTDLSESVHLSDWPEAKKVSKFEQRILEDMAKIRTMINLGLQGRANEGIKVRQPLPGPVVRTRGPIATNGLRQILEEELNVKTAHYQDVGSNGVDEIIMNFEITPELKREGLMREIVRQVQNARKQADLQVENRINLALETASEDLRQAIEEHKETIQQETLASTLNAGPVDGFETTVSVEDHQLNIRLQKA